jgi:surface protein
MNETINEKRYQFILWFYKIRTQYPRMGLFQPDFLFVIFRKMMPSKYNRSDEDIKTAVNGWGEDPVTAAVQYGHISKWNTSLVINMRGLFEHKRNFNDDISKWNVSSVTNMDRMFFLSSFNGDISGWNVSSVTNMEFMFSNTPFNGDVSRWMSVV